MKSRMGEKVLQSCTPYESIDTHMHACTHTLVRDRSSDKDFARLSKQALTHSKTLKRERDSCIGTNNREKKKKEREKKVHAEYTLSMNG